jgi:hypothetical protein
MTASRIVPLRELHRRPLWVAQPYRDPRDGTTKLKYAPRKPQEFNPSSLLSTIALIFLSFLFGCGIGLIMLNLQSRLRP